MAALETVADPAERLRRVEARLERERRARIEAEQLLESRARELYEANLALEALAADLERRVAERTHELSAARYQALQQAETDALTGIANRAAFSRLLGETLAEPRACNAGVAVLLIDLDDFKTVNDTLGHATGDALLVEVARRLVDIVRPGDAVARLGGDEFAVVARGIGFRQGALQMAHRLLNALCRPVIVGGRSVACSCSIGLAQAPPRGAHADGLLRDADLALYASKRAGRARVSSFEAALRDELEHKGTLDAEVRAAVLEDRIEPWYQPIMRCSSGLFVGAEVLARWHLPGGEVRPPAAFLETVEALGLLDTMMENMLRRALPETLTLVADGTLEYLSINVSPTQFNHGWALTRLPQLLAEAAFPARAVVVELTETALLHDIDRTRTMLAALTDSGMHIALDDFGIGYSNFSLLRQLRFHLLKLDRTLSADIETDEHARAVTECILALAVRLKIDVVGEGVETQVQADLLKAAGCVAQQGYLHARPLRDLVGFHARMRCRVAQGEVQMAASL